MEEKLKEIDDMIFYLLNIRNEILSELGVQEFGGWTEEELEIASKAYAELEKDYKFVA